MVTLYVTETGLILGEFPDLQEADAYHDRLLEIYQGYDFPEVTFLVWGELQAKWQERK